MPKTKQVAIIGAGLMGHAIALVFARAGHQIVVQDPVDEMLKSLPDRVRHSLSGVGISGPENVQIVARILTAKDLPAAVEEADLVIEAAPEKLELKRRIFESLLEHAPENCLLASNTSVIQISRIAEGLSQPERIVGTHWWNPPHLIPLVEVIRTQWTLEIVVDEMMAILASVGKRPVRVDKDVPGFIGNRLQHALWREAVALVANGVCTAEAVDEVVKFSFGKRLAVLGPLENADLVGTDLTLDIHLNVLADLEASPLPSPYLEGLVAAGKLGMKSGEGFRKWTQQEADAVRRRVVEHLSK